MKATIYTNDFNRIIAATRDFVAPSTNERQILKYIQLEFNAADSSVTASAVDGFKMSVEYTYIENCDEDFVAYVHRNIRLPATSYAELEVTNGELLIRCGDCIFGCQQPRNDFIDWPTYIPAPPTFKIGFNGDYLLSALRAAKVSGGGRFNKPVILEFRSNREPLILRTNEDDIKMVLPIRLKEDNPHA